MATNDFYSAIKMLNDKCADDWQVAFDLLSKKEQSFVKKAMNGSSNFSKETIIFTLTKEDDYLKYDKQIWKWSKKYPELLISNRGNVLSVIKILKESDLKLVVEAKILVASMRKHGRMVITHEKNPVMLHILVYEAFKERDTEKVYFKDGDATNCKLNNLFTSRDKTHKKRRISIEEHQLFPYKDEIFKMRYGQETPYEKIGKIYKVSGPTIKRFIQRIKEVELDE